MDTIDLTILRKEFLDYYGGAEEDIRTFFAPGRVNLIGEHTDYNNGNVMPFGIQYGTYLLARKTGESKVRLKSLNFPGTASICVKDGISKTGNQWFNYPLGVIHEFKLLGFETGGLDLFFYGDIPNEAGLSSSASIEIVTATALNELFHCGLGKLDLVKAGQRAENDFVGMKCGIMDQFAVTMGEEGRAVFLDCGTLEFDLVPFELKDSVILIINTNKKRGLADSKYNERRAECEEAVKMIGVERPIGSLSEIGPEDFEKLRHLIRDPVVLRRAKHVITENARVVSAKNALEKNDLVGLGELMTRSHNSLRDDYEVSCFELDTVVELANSVEGVLGARMTGAGFGGCAIALARRNVIPELMRAAGEGYREKTGLEASFYEAVAGPGARELI